MPANPKGNIAEKVWALAEPFAQQLGLSIWDVRFLKEGATWYLRIIIDKPGGINITDCEAMSNAVDGPLDEADFIAQSYHLQVSSPGIERDLRLDTHFAACIGENIQLRLIRPVENVRDFKGTLTGFADGILHVTLSDGRELAINKKETSFVRLDDFGGF